ncbi:MAG: 50S ribosomal protein L28 [Candidatus Omnitrophica bacterium]|jgi:large subunit ribosomal protein L28|nr:50S ribosomal protein L28 [Candidatus Omnitrophota bacterium]
MFKVCLLCGKGPMAGKRLVRKGLAKKKGGTGSKVSRRNARTFMPNLQKLRIVVDGHPRKAYVCTRCIKKGKVVKA